MTTVLPIVLAVLGAGNGTPPDSGASASPRKIKPAAAYDIVAMMPLSSLGSTDEVVEAIERVLVGEMRGLLGERLITPEDLLKKGGEARGAFMECEGRVVCLVEVMGGLGWDAFVVGNIAGLGDNRIISLKIMDVRTGSQLRTVREVASGNQDTLIKQMRKAVVTLVAPEMLVATVELRCPQPGVTVLIDGQSVGTSPLKNARIEVPVGPHAIEATADGRVGFSSLVDLGYGESKVVEITLADNTLVIGAGTPFRARWWTWTLAGVGAVSAGIGGVFNALQVDTVNQINLAAQNGNLTIQQQSLFRREEEQWTFALAFYIAGAAVLGTVSALLGLDLVLF